MWGYPRPKRVVTPEQQREWRRRLWTLPVCVGTPLLGMLFVWAQEGFGIADAAGHGDVRGVARALALGADPDTRDGWPLTRALLDSHRETAAMLLAAGANPDGSNRFAPTPLWEAAYHGRRKTAALLLAFGARTDVRVPMGTTPAEAAREAGHEELAQFIEHWPEGQ